MAHASQTEPGRVSAEAVLAAIEHAGHFLPDQAPIGVFVHHNTLHAFAHLPFHEAVARATTLFGAEPYMTEDAFRRCHARGRIGDDDLAAAIAEGCPDDTVLIDRPSWTLRRRELRRLAMLHAVHAETPEGLRYRLEEEALATRLAADVPAACAARIVEEGARHVRARLDAGRLPGEQADWPGSTGRSIRALRRAVTRDPEAIAVATLWARCRQLADAAAADADAPSSSPPDTGRHRPGRDGRHRDHLLRLTGEDTDRMVNPELIRLASAYLDLGMAYWPMPDRELGFYPAVRALLAGTPLPPAAWLREAARDLRAQAGRGDRAVDAVIAVLVDLGVSGDMLEDYLTWTVRALPGWAGMMHRLARHPADRPANSPPASLVDFVAVRLVLDRAAVRWLARTALGWNGPLAHLPEHLPEHLPGHPSDGHGRSPRAALVPASPSGDHDRAYRLFRLLCAAGISAPAAAELDVGHARTLLAELDAFAGLARRRTFHEAYERHHRRMILDAMAEHRSHLRLGRRPADPAETTAPAEAAGPAVPASPRFQVIACIDDRAESLRRHIEELEPRAETFGAAGFFGVAMDFRGIDDAHAAALCPVVQTPAHEIEEHPREEDRHLHARRRARRRLWARLAHGLSVGSRALVRGQLLTLGLGTAAVIPMTSRVLFPRASTRLRRRLAALLLPRPRTMLRSVRAPAAAATPEAAESHSERGKLLGFTAAEKVARVASLLEGMGMVERFAPLVLVLGHGASSLNNPHASAYDCGACGGHRGGPNARLFADMANRPEVRAGLGARGIRVPEGTWFLGGMHDTTSDALTLYDTDRVPAHLAAEREALERLLDRARMRDAHERCRRFASAPRTMTPAQALRHVEARAAHLAEPRPECGHATNAVCIVGRRALTRGLFLDRRAFLVSYDPTRDPGGAILERTLVAVGPVGAGINLEYYFSFVDNERYGCGTKLPHNVTGLLGVMNGHASDLRTGLPWQMVEIHEPVRLLTIVEARPEMLLDIAGRQPGVHELVVNRWIQLVSVDPDSGAMQVYGDRGFVPYEPAREPLPVAPSSMAWYQGRPDHLPPARIVPDPAGAADHEEHPHAA